MSGCWFRSWFVHLLMAGCAAFMAIDGAAQTPPSFEIKRIRVDGDSLLDAAHIDALLAPFIGANKTLIDVQAAREALLAEYARRGWGAVEVLVPEQEVRDGEVVVRVIEARVSQVRVTGNEHFDTANIRRSLPAVQEGQAPNTRALAAQLRLANTNPLKQTTAVLQPGAEAGSVDVEARVSDQRPYRFSIGLDNTGNPETGNLRLGLGFQHANVFGLDHVLSLQYVTAPYDDDNTHRLSAIPGDDVRIWGAAYRIPLPALGDSIEFTAGYANVNSGVVQGIFNVTGAGRIYGARYNFGLQGTPWLEHQLSLGIEKRDYDNRVFAVGSGVELVPDYSLQPIGVTYSGLLRAPQGEGSFSAGLVRNLPGGSQGDQAAFDAVRRGAEADYTLLRASASYTHALPSDFQARVRFAGQYTSDVLLPGEQFGIGGMDSLRGLYERQLLADKGYSGSLEFYSPDLGRYTGQPDLRLRFLAFVDFAKGWRNEPQAIELAKVDARSYGVGLRMAWSNTYSLRFDYATLDPVRPYYLGRSERATFSMVVVF
ncbi:ShlB/FhaC/HecB family hemolysin secretion/activation protein [Variovorax sp. J2P1-59]|uniref:ShlB/FhaC/HecB family hemolysin secretion/activation protein n=1 Tax=Variovorax flavidus TaxID=3053501 RepID=UPI002576EAD0|nr:ShlB/FhaC/HecB family hemolysin secretion/activation protein [Variovorax sp. J2P1-59]MDM0074835.1 ShlB/FhaC/HecB family hemolysin secretion/activation protein [Variovorax sp. J2P1-59]